MLSMILYLWYSQCVHMLVSLERKLRVVVDQTCILHNNSTTPPPYSYSSRLS